MGTTKDHKTYKNQEHPGMLFKNYNSGMAFPGALGYQIKIMNLNKLTSIKHWPAIVFMAIICVITVKAKILTVIAPTITKNMGWGLSQWKTPKSVSISDTK